MTLFDYLAAAIPLLGTLIFVHELGHFVAAKACGVRVLKFSLGFGPPIGFGQFRMRWVRAGTEYVVAWFPLGGFVKMLGEPLPGGGVEEAPEMLEVLDAAPDEYLSSKNLWQKLAITLAGPAMNLGLPVVAFLFVLWIGVPKATPVIGMVERGSPAEAAGLVPGDLITTVAGEPVAWWDDIAKAIARSEGPELSFGVLRDGQELPIAVALRQRGTLDEFGSATEVGWIGIGNRRLPALVGLPSLDVPAGVAGLRSGDRVAKVGETEVEDWEGFRRAYELAAEASGSVMLEVLRSPAPAEDLASTEASAEPEAISLVVPALASVADLGVVPATILIDVVSPGLPAERAGLREGDLLLAVDGEIVGSFQSLANTVRSSGGRALEITFAREGETSTVTLQPELVKDKGPLDIEGMTDDVYRIGIQHAHAALPGAYEIDRERNPFRSVPRSVGMSVDLTVLFLRGMGKLFSGEVGTDKLAGPIGIAEIARKSLDLGWQAYLSTMILISINLGIVNLLPIPILDGGQALIYLIEGVKRSPISLRSRELVQQTGLFVLVLLMGLAFWNDLSRHWNQFVEWISTAL